MKDLKLKLELNTVTNDVHVTRDGIDFTFNIGEDTDWWEAFGDERGDWDIHLILDNSIEDPDFYQWEARVYEAEKDGTGYYNTLTNGDCIEIPINVIPEYIGL